MRRLFWIVFFILLAVALALVIHWFPGNVLVVVDQWRVQVSLSFAILAAVAAFVLVYALTRLVVWLVDIPSRYQGWRGRRAEQRDQSRLEQGWIALLEGRHVFAEKVLTQVSREANNWRRQVLADLSAARAAHEIGAFERRDVLIKQAQTLVARHDRQSNLKVPVAAAAADLWLAQGKAEQALTVLTDANVQDSKDVHTLKLLLRTHQQLNHHVQVLTLARLLGRKEAITSSQSRALIEGAAASELKSLAQDDQKEAFWKSLRTEEKVLPQVALAGASLFQAQGKLKESSKTLEMAIKHQFDAQLLNAYAKAEPDQVTPRLQQAERWLSERADDPDLLATLGALCLAAQMWGQAQRYLEKSARLRGDARVHALLGSLFDRLGQPERAASHWRLATAVSAALPTLALDVVLPAAEVQADPAYVHADAFADDPLVSPQNLNIDPLSGGYEKRKDEEIAHIPHQEYDEFFDSAPIPVHAFESIDQAAAPAPEKSDSTKRDH